MTMQAATAARLIETQNALAKAQEDGKAYPGQDRSPGDGTPRMPRPGGEGSILVARHDPDGPWCAIHATPSCRSPA